MTLDPMFTAKEPFTHHQRNNILVCCFVVPDQITATLSHAHPVTASELLRIYSITLLHTHLNSTLQSHTMNNILDNIILFRLP